VTPPPEVFPGVCRASSEGYKVRAGQQDTIGVTITNNGSSVGGAKVRITLPGGKVITGTTNKNGKATFTVKPNHSGTILVRSGSCKGMAKVKVFAAKAATAQQAPSFTG
jgi:archaellum component FlaF (FlaF/FlaG flagellin family)